MLLNEYKLSIKLINHISITRRKVRISKIQHVKKLLTSRCIVTFKHVFAVLLNDYKLSFIVIKSISITRRNVRVPKKDKIETETDVEFVVS